jgi:hypothetical protein
VRFAFALVIVALGLALFVAMAAGASHQTVQVIADVLLGVSIALLLWLFLRRRL